MMWLPKQSPADWRESVEALVDVAPDHASLYLLELYPNAPLKETMARAGWSLAPDDDAAEMYLWSMGRLDAAGYRQYEISNVAKPGAESRHNLKYWEDGEWLGFGCGAHSTRDGIRWKNVSATEDYIQRVVEGERFRLKPADLPPWNEQKKRSLPACALQGASTSRRSARGRPGRLGTVRAGPRALHRGGDGPP